MTDIPATAGVTAHLPPLNDYNMRRLAWIERDGTLTSGCSSCRQATLERFVEAGWIVPAAPGEPAYRLTDEGRRRVADWQSQS